MHPIHLNVSSRLLTAGLLLVLSAQVHSDSVSKRLQDVFGESSTAGNQEILDPSEAFRFSAQAIGPGSVTLGWEIAEGYYLYRDKFAIALTHGAARLDSAGIVLPPGHVKQDEVFGEVQVVTGDAEVRLALVREPGPELPVALSVGFQGCKEQSVCYPPIKRNVMVTLPPLAVADPGSVPGPAAASGAVLSAEDAIVQRLRDSGLAGNLVAFFVFGLLLSLTPCVFPMVPILSGIVVGDGGAGTHARGFSLSAAYVLAMATGYAVLGVLAGSFRLNLQAASQAPWVIALFSAIFVVLALSMFDLFQVQMPAAIQTRLHSWSGRRAAGTLRGAAGMGLLSAVVVGPCVAPPLAGALLYISQTGNAVLGGAALFAMGLGLGVPLLALGISAGSLLPRVGRWMESVKQVVGVLMLGVAVWFLGRILPGPATLLLWALLLMVSAIFMGALDPLDSSARWGRLWKGLGLALLVYGVALIVGAASGSDDALQPLQRLSRFARAAPAAPLPFRSVASVRELREQLAEASLSGKPVMLDFYADWCITCKEMESKTFPDAKVRAQLAGVVLLQADVTADDDVSRELLEAFDLYGPPAILFFDRHAQERRAQRVIGFLPPDEFLAHVRAALGT